VAVAARRTVEAKNKLSLRVDHENELHVCKGCGCILKTKIWVPLKTILNNTEIKTMHPNCWVIKENL